MAAPAPSAPSAVSFSRFFESWISKQTRHLTTLRAAASTVPATRDAELRRLVDQVLAHYEHYYLTKAAAAEADVASMFAPSWTSATENLFLWCGGWRPAAAVRLLLTKSAMPQKSQRYVLRPDLADLSGEQLLAVERLHRSTVEREREIREVAASAQEALTTAKMVELTAGGVIDVEEMAREMRTKEDGMKRVLEMADTLRLDTLKAVVALLRPAQAVHFLIAAAELHLTVHRFGRLKDGRAPPPPALSCML